MTQRSQLLAAAALLTVALASPAWGPVVLRRLPWFEVQRVEVSGTRLLAPHDVMAASGIRLGQSVWEDPARWEEALRAHPVIAAARVTRRLPHTLRVRVEEKEPVGFVVDGVLRPATAAGEILPLDPARTPVDVPIVHGPWPDTAARAPTRALLAELGRLRRLDPGLLAEVSEVRAAGAGELVLVHRVGEIVLPAGVEAERLLQLRAVLTDLERRTPAAQAAVSVDLRFQDQIVVRLSSSV